MRHAPWEADFSKIEAPVLGHFGTADDLVSVDDAKSLEQEMKDAGADVRFEFYEGKGHAFSTTPTDSAPTMRTPRANPGSRHSRSCEPT